MDDISQVKPGAVPAHIAQASNKLSLNAAAHAGIQASFAVISIRGKDWRVKHRGTETMLKASPGLDAQGNALPVQPMQYLDVVVVGMAHAVSKKFYLRGFEDGVRGAAPDCFSTNGISPDPAAAHKQNTMCATCQHNAWGSANIQGSRAKACRDGRRIAVVPAGDIDNDYYDGPMLLDVPPTSLKALDRYVTHLDRMGADISQVVTRMEFDRTVTHQQLLFTHHGWVPTAADYDAVCEIGASDQVNRMLEASVNQVTYDPDAEELPPRPAHLARSAPGAGMGSDIQAKAAAAVAQVQAARATPLVAAPPPPVETPPAMTAEAGAEAARAQVTKRTAPPPFKAPAAEAAPPDDDAVASVAPQTAVVKGAPPDMQDAIDSLLN